MERIKGANIVKFFVAAVAAAALLSACTTTLQVAELDPETNRYATSSVVAPEEVLVSEGYDVDAVKAILFVRNNFDDAAQVGQYFEDSISSFGFFDEVMRKDEFERYLIQEGLQDEVGAVDGFASLSKASKELGDFLFVDLNLELAAGYQTTLTMNVYDAREAKELLSVKRVITNWAGLDGPLFQPVLNSFFDWVDANSDGKIDAEPATDPAAN